MEPSIEQRFELLDRVVQALLSEGEEQPPEFWDCALTAIEA